MKSKPPSPNQSNDAEWTVELLPTAGEHMATQFLNELLSSIARTETYAKAQKALREGYLQALQPYLQPRDLQALGWLPQPSPLQLLVDSYTLYAFFRAWLRRQGFDPDAILGPSRLRAGRASARPH